MRKSTVSRLFLLFLVFFFTVAVAFMAFWWSLGQTILFTTSVIQDDFFGIIFGLIIQLGPQVFLALASTSSGNERIVWLSMFWTFSGIDALTNIGARMIRTEETGSTYGPLWWTVGIFIDVIVVFGEEMIGYSLAVMFHIVGDLIEDFGGDAPSWLMIGERTARSLSTGRPQQPPQQRPPQPPQQGGGQPPQGGGKRGRQRLPQGQPGRDLPGL